MHHEPKISTEIQEALKSLDTALLLSDEAERLELGATGEFPEGKLTSTDEGEIKFAIADYQGKVIINFGTPVQSLGLSPKQARDLARLLIIRAKKIKAGR